MIVRNLWCYKPEIIIDLCTNLAGDTQKEKKVKYSFQYARFVKRIRKITKNLLLRISYDKFSD